MRNCKTSARTAAKTGFKCLLLFRPATLAAILMLVAGLSSGCNGYNDTTAYLQNMERPIIVIAKDSNAAILKGHDCRLFVAKSQNWIGGAIIKTYNVGDTLR